MTLTQFARKIGVSTTTISQVVNGTGRISPQTRAMVTRRMTELGYAPNPHARQLVTGRSHIVAFCHSDQDIFADLFLSEFAHGVQTALRPHGYGLLVENRICGDAQSPLDGWLRSRAIDGAILVQGWSSVAEWVRTRASARTPIVVYSGREKLDLPYVAQLVLDDQIAIAEAVDHLLEYGHRRVGYIGVGVGDSAADAFRGELARRGLPTPDELAIEAGFTPLDGGKAMRRLLALADPPTAVYCRKDDLAIGALNAALHLGIRVPQDISLIGHDDVPLASVMEPPLTTIRADYEALGREAVRMLFALMGGAESQGLMASVPCAFVERETTAAARWGSGKAAEI